MSHRRRSKRRRAAAGAAKPAAGARDTPDREATKADVSTPGSAPPVGTPPRHRRWVPWFMAGASYAGFVISLYLTFVHYRGYVSPCYVMHGCEQVQTSRFSTIGGVPLALLGTLLFGVMFYLAIGLLTRSSLTLVRTYKVLAYLAALAVIPLFLIQAIWLRAFCSYCVASEVIMLSMWIVSFMLIPGEQRKAPQAAAAPAGR